MKNILIGYSIAKCIRVCIGCGSFIGFKKIKNEFSENQIDIICQNCATQLIPFLTVDWLKVYPHPTMSLYSWPVGASGMPKKILNQLKGLGGPSEYFGFANKLCRQRLAMSTGGEYFKKGTLFVPAPPRIFGDRDHAYNLGLALSQVWGEQLLCPLRRTDHTEQKQKSREKRWTQVRTRFDVIEPLSVTARLTKRIVFVDDVITTGATAMAAYEALGRPKCFEIWTIFHRPSLRHRQGFDITRHL